ncbi:RagB/SusD family nutrient uptake outer membrane protein [Flavivirga amylovorans]|uniref:RagB/SusD family nutrient uptake outer membrane protein n=1 Tax=Flavivirga amylovorans TaxID=870486 RepID=A0ABT8WVX6_9FLAO|nr:RagB/SusD family nutrient uptake outer membrane protein [Flavivirga amylovorans]MDO5985813.1 RagB/SusD family nutrient uptake outer membrane protein [Flavivirga amylovorans]
MKHIKNIYILTLCITLLSLQSCELTPVVDEVEPLFLIDADVSVTDENSANNALIGVYSQYTQKGLHFPTFFIMPDILIGYSNLGFATARNPEAQAWATNNPLVANGDVMRNSYAELYTTINRANWVINLTSKLDASVFNRPERQAEIIAEAKLLRAITNLYLLRTWGQFYDTNSEYGIVLRTDPALKAEVFPRNTVQEVYDLILSDIEDGIANAPDNRGKQFLNKTFAQAFKAKILLYMGNYAEAAAVAKDVMDNAGGDFDLQQAPFSDLFFPHTSLELFNKSEILFAMGGSLEQGPSSLGYARFYYGIVASVSPAYTSLAGTGALMVNGQSINHDGERISSTVSRGRFGALVSSKYGDFDFNLEMHYIMRMSELYLIFAEANARANNMVTTDALNALNAVRLRADATTTGGDGFETYPATIGLDQFLEAVRIEKLMELYVENGENWYDAVRYDYADGFGAGFQVSDIKPSATDSDKFIFPIPQENLALTGDIVIQNPGYSN